MQELEHVVAPERYDAYVRGSASQPAPAARDDGSAGRPKVPGPGTVGPAATGDRDPHAPGILEGRPRRPSRRGEERRAVTLSDSYGLPMGAGGELQTEHEQAGPADADRVRATEPDHVVEPRSGLLPAAPPRCSSMLRETRTSSTGTPPPRGSAASLGSVGLSCVLHAPCPVLVVPMPTTPSTADATEGDSDGPGRAMTGYVLDVAVVFSGPARIGGPFPTLREAGTAAGATAATSGARLVVGVDGPMEPRAP